MMGFAEDREVKDPVLVQQTAREGMKVLEEMVKHGQSVPMSEFVKILQWQKDCLCEIFNEETKKARHEGWKEESHTWCGEPWHAFAIPTLHIFQR